VISPTDADQRTVLAFLATRPAGDYPFDDLRSALADVVGDVAEMALRSAARTAHVAMVKTQGGTVVRVDPDWLRRLGVQPVGTESRLDVKTS
jgi:hypothetical protein